jgi:hypothetical protein
MADRKLTQLGGLGTCSGNDKTYFVRDGNPFYAELSGILNFMYAPPRVSITGSTYTILSRDYIVGIRGTGVQTLNLPSAPTVSGRLFVIKDEFGSGTNYPVLLKPVSGQFIEGSTGFYINSNRMALNVYSDGSGFYAY